MALDKKVEETKREVVAYVQIDGMDPEMDRRVARKEGFEQGLEQGDDRRRSADISLVERFIASGGSMEELLAAMKAES